MTQTRAWQVQVLPGVYLVVRSTGVKGARLKARAQTIGKLRGMWTTWKVLEVGA